MDINLRISVLLNCWLALITYFKQTAITRVCEAHSVYAQDAIEEKMSKCAKNKVCVCVCVCVSLETVFTFMYCTWKHKNSYLAYILFGG
jgi:hypothetical protein